MNNILPFVFDQISSTLSPSTTMEISPDFEDLDHNYVGHGQIDDVNGTECSNAYCVPPEEYEDMIKDHIFPTIPEWILISANIVIFIVGLVGNLLVCVAVYRNTTMRTVTNYFIVVVWDVTETWFLGDALCKIVLYFQTVSVSVSVLTLTFISIERWYAICFPLKFKATTSRAKRAISLIWFISITLDIPELIVLHTRPREDLPSDILYFTQCLPNWGSSEELAFTTIRILLLYVIPLMFMTIAYYQIVQVLWSPANFPGGQTDQQGGSTTLNGASLRNGSHGHHAQYTAQRKAHKSKETQVLLVLTPLQRSGGGGNSTSQGTAVDFQLKGRRKAAKMLVAVVIILIIQLPQNDVIGTLVIVCHWLPYANSAINPIIYNFMSNKFRKEFKRAFSCMCGSPSPASRVYSSHNNHNQINQSNRNHRQLHQLERSMANRRQYPLRRRRHPIRYPNSPLPGRISSYPHNYSSQNDTEMSQVVL